jgi:hypothetical protein
MLDRLPKLTIPRPLTLVWGPALALAAALAWLVLSVTSTVDEGRCLSFWDDGTPIAVVPPQARDLCRHVTRSPCYPLGFDERLPKRYVLANQTLLPLLHQVYGVGRAWDPRSRAPEVCRGLISLQADEIDHEGSLIRGRLKKAEVELQHLGGRVEPCRRSGTKHQCGKKRPWNWVGPTKVRGIPVTRMHLTQSATQVLSVPVFKNERALSLIAGFMPKSGRLRTPFFGIARVRVFAGERLLHEGVIYPGFRDHRARVRLPAAPPGRRIEVRIDCVGSRFGELWLSGRFGS